MTSQPTVVVCRAPDQAGDLADLLLSAGITPVVTPVIAIAEPLDGGSALRAAVSSIDDIDLVVLTSPNAATALVGALNISGHSDDGWARLTVVAIGPGTAAAATSLGLRVAGVARRSVAEGLVAELDGLEPGRGRLLLPQAERARPVIRDAMTARGWRVDAPTAYRTLPAPLSRQQVERVAVADAVAFTSSSTVEALVAAVGADRVPATVVTIGPETSRTARLAGLSVRAEADPHTIAGLVDAVLAAVASPSSTTSPSHSTTATAAPTNGPDRGEAAR